MKDGGPAFPVKYKVLADAPGMSLRAYFAGQALSGVLAIECAVSRTNGEVMAGMVHRVTRSCLELADALIAELDR